MVPAVIGRRRTCVDVTELELEGLGAPERMGDMGGEIPRGDDLPEDEGVLTRGPERDDDEVEPESFSSAIWDKDAMVSAPAAVGLLGDGRSKLEMTLGTREPGLVDLLDDLDDRDE